jgi:hypothetical protein
MRLYSLMFTYSMYILEIFKFKVLLLEEQEVSLENKVYNYGITLYCSILLTA